MKLLPRYHNIKRTIPFAIANSVEHECRQEEPQADKKCFKYEACPESKHTSRRRPIGKIYTYCGNNADDLDHLPVSHTRLTVVQLALFE
jgi:hypothetical protein